MQPFVSVLMPTYNRRKFIPTAIEIYKGQTYPKARMEWIILDDGDDKVEDLFEKASKDIPNIRYMYEPTKQNIGAKRNKLIGEAKGEIIVWMDDDDYYPSNRISQVITAFANNKKIDIVGSSQLYLYYTDTKKICTVGPFSPYHGTNGTIGIRTAFAKKRKYDESVPYAEEAKYFDNFTIPMKQLDPMKTMLVICHNKNTYDKKIIRGDYSPNKDQRNPSFKETTLKLRDFIKEIKLREFYNSL
jgi:glycosyltransferase involved in cell wall biosynthesis